MAIIMGLVGMVVFGFFFAISPFWALVALVVAILQHRSTPAPPTEYREPSANSPVVDALAVAGLWSLLDDHDDIEEDFFDDDDDYDDDD